MTTVINGTSTSASAPAVVGDDGDTGLYFPSSNEVAIATAGSQKAYFGEFGYLTSVSTSTSSLTLKKGAAGADGIDYLQLRDSSNNAKMVITGAGNISSFGGQITFPSSQSPSSDPNTLDDYEEGTWTPTLSATGISVTYTTRTGYYIKIGRFVKLSFYIQTNAISAQGSGTLTITGFPAFSPSTNEESPGNFWSVGAVKPATAAYVLIPRVQDTTSIIILDSATGGLLQTGALSAGSYCIGQINYVASS